MRRSCRSIRRSGPGRRSSAPSRCGAGSHLTASRMVTPDARPARGASQSATRSGWRLPVSRSTQPMALRMKNSRSSSIVSAYVANRAKCVGSPRRSGTSSDSRADLRIQKSSSVAQRSRVASSSGARSTSEPMTSAARPSTSAQVPEVRRRPSTSGASAAVSSVRRSVSRMTVASLHSNTGPSHRRRGQPGQPRSGQVRVGAPPARDDRARRRHRGAAEFELALEVVLPAGGPLGRSSRA